MADSKKITVMKKALTLLAITCLVLITVSIPRGIILAQSSPLASISPASTDINIGDSTTVSVYLSSMVDINAFDITITYDPTVVTLESYAFGGFLSNLAQIRESNTSGSLNLVYTQLATAGANGEGTLLTLTFSGIAAGKSAITIGSLSLAQPSGNSFQTALQNGEINVTAKSATAVPTAVPTTVPTTTSTSTSTTTATYTSTFTSTPTHTSTPTRTSTAMPRASLTPTKTSSISIARTSTKAPSSTPKTVRTVVPTATSLALSTLTVQAQTLNASTTTPTPVVAEASAVNTAAPGGEVTPTAAIALPIPQTGQFSQLLCFSFLFLLIILFILLVIILRRRAKKQNS